MEFITAEAKELVELGDEVVANVDLNLVVYLYGMTWRKILWHVVIANLE
jgi:hypothetical protein